MDYYLIGTLIIQSMIKRMLDGCSDLYKHTPSLRL